MAIKTKVEEAQLQIDDTSSSIILSVTIGNGQIGGSITYFLDDPDTIIGKGKLSKLSIGKGATIKGKKLFIETNILDSNPNTLDVTAKYNFSGCTPQITKYADSLNSVGDIFSYQLTFEFI